MDWFGHWVATRTRECSGVYDYDYARTTTTFAVRLMHTVMRRDVMLQNAMQRRRVVVCASAPVAVRAPRDRGLRVCGLNVPLNG